MSLCFSSIQSTLKGVQTWSSCDKAIRFHNATGSPIHIIFHDFVRKYISERITFRSQFTIKMDVIYHRSSSNYQYCNLEITTPCIRGIGFAFPCDVIQRNYTKCPVKIHKKRHSFESEP